MAEGPERRLGESKCRERCVSVLSGGTWMRTPSQTVKDPVSHYFKFRFLERSLYSEENKLKGGSPCVLITTITILNVIIIIVAERGLPYCRDLGFTAMP